MQRKGDLRHVWSDWPHTSSDCTNEAKCPNCTGSHSAFSKSCPKWLFEKRVQQVKAEKGISFIEARKLSAQRAKAGQLREAAQQLLWWVPELLRRVPGAAPHHQPLCKKLYVNTER